MANVKIYTTPTCGYCQLAKAWLKENNIDYEEFDVTTDAGKREEIIQKTGQMAVPVIDADGEIIIGFDKARLSEKLGVK